MSTEEPVRTAAPRWKRWFRRVLILVFVVCFGVFVFVMVWRFIGRRNVEQHLSELRVAGVPTTADELDAYYQLPPGATDCTSLWLDATAPLAAAKDELAQSGLPFVAKDVPEPPLPGEPLPQQEQVEALLARFKPSLDLMHQAASQGGAARLPSDFHAGFLAEHPFELGRARPAANLLHLAAYSRAHRGDVAGALASLSTLAALGKALDKKPDIITFFTRCSLDRMRYQTIARLVPSMALSDDQLAELQRTTQTTDYREHYIAAARGERVKGLLAFDSKFEVDGGRRVSYAQLPTKWSDLSFYLLVLDRMERAGDLPAPERLRHAEETNDIIMADITSWRWRIHIMCALLLPAVESCGMVLAYNEATRDALVVLLAAQRFHAKNGHWPAALADLVPEFLPAVPIDPCDGQPLRYRIDADALTVYSVGKNRSDEGGELNESLRLGDYGLRMDFPK